MTDISSPFDPAALDRLVRFGGEKLLASMIDVFRSNGRERLDAARAALDAGDAAAAALAVHSLKSSAAQLGAMKLSGLCADAEVAARAERLEPLAGSLPELVAAYDDAVRWMSGRVARQGSEG